MKHSSMEEYLYYLAAYEDKMPLAQFLSFAGENEQLAWKSLMELQQGGLVRIDVSAPENGEVSISLTEKGRVRAELKAETQIAVMLSGWDRQQLTASTA